MAVNLARCQRSLLSAQSALGKAHFRCALVAPGQTRFGVMQQTRNAGMGGMLPGIETPYIYPEETLGEIPWDRNFWNPQPYRNPKLKHHWPSHHSANIAPTTQMVPDMLDLDAADRERHALEAVYVKQLQEQEAADRVANPEKWAKMDADRQSFAKMMAETLTIPKTPSTLTPEQMERYRKFWDEKGRPLPGTELPESRLLKQH